MTPTAIKFLVYDLIRTGSTDEQIVSTLMERGAEYSDLVAYIVATFGQATGYDTSLTKGK
jgi:cytochrome c-type biogenesis protein CcmH/NrfF